MIPFVIQGDNIVLYIDNAPVIIDVSHLNYKLVKQALIDKDFDRVRELSTVRKPSHRLPAVELNSFTG